MSIVNWFDVFVIVLLIVGVFHGRKRGMSLELIPLLEFLLILVVGSRVYSFLGQKLVGLTNGNLDTWVANIIAYVTFGIVAHLIVSRIRSAIGEKLVGSDIFGGMEYYFGMMAGMIRYATYIFIGMAILHAKAIDKAGEAKYRKTEKANLGDITFPTYTSIQMDIFEKSRIGTLTRAHVRHLLIAPAAAETKKSDPIARQRERAVFEAFTGQEVEPRKSQQPQKP